jgi:hypothetical protein
LLKCLGPAVALALSIGPFDTLRAGPAAERTPSPQNRQPNVVLIITDDQGYGDLRVHGNPKLDTPNLDRLASRAVQFQSFLRLAGLLALPCQPDDGALQLPHRRGGYRAWPLADASG